MKTQSLHISLKFILPLAIFIIAGHLSASGQLNYFGLKSKKGSGDFTFYLQGSSARYVNVDSALIVLDKYDHTGAGAVIKMVTVDSCNGLNLTGIPVGKYYAGIYTFGIYKQYIPLVINVIATPGKKNSNTAKIIVTDTERYVLGKAEIPAENINLFTFSSYYQ